MVEMTKRLGAIVIAYAPPEPVRDGLHDGIFGGDAGAAAIIARVNDDGTLNLSIFHPTGGNNLFATGVRAKEDVDKLDADDPERNAITWEWPN